MSLSAFTDLDGDEPDRIDVRCPGERGDGRGSCHKLLVQVVPPATVEMVAYCPRCKRPWRVVVGSS